METLYLLGLRICPAISSHLDSCIGRKWVYSSHRVVLLSWNVRVGDGSMSIEHRLNDTDTDTGTGTHKSSEKSLSTATISTTICMWIVLGLNPGFLMDRLAVSCLAVETGYQTRKFYWETDSWMNTCSEKLCLSVKHSSFPFRRPKFQNPILYPNNLACFKCLSTVHDCSDSHSFWFIIALVYPD
jgi:hypothetical protein